VGAKKVVMSEIKCRLKEEKEILKCENLADYVQYENTLYKIFTELYEQEKLFYKEQPVRMKHYPPDYDIKTGFYHMICENYQHTGNEKDRKPNMRRCERIKWPTEIIGNCSKICEKIMIWENERHGKRNVLLFCPELDYLIVLSKRKNYFLLTTAYPVEYSNRRNDLIKEYTEYVNKQRTSG
jgi:hypothetical protein